MQSISLVSCISLERSSDLWMLLMFSFVSHCLPHASSKGSESCVACQWGIESVGIVVTSTASWGHGRHEVERVLDH